MYYNSAILRSKHTVNDCIAELRYAYRTMWTKTESIRNHAKLTPEIEK